MASSLQQFGRTAQKKRGRRTCQRSIFVPAMIQYFDVMASFTLASNWLSVMPGVNSILGLGTCRGSLQ
jgi:hypothetical protein